MPLDLAKMQADRASLTVTFNDNRDDDLHLVYQPSRYTERTEAVYRPLLDRGQVAGGFADLILTLVVSWDATDGGQPVLLTRTPAAGEVGINSVPLDVLRVIAEALIADVAGDPKARSVASNGSFANPPLTPRVAPIGTAHLSQPVTQGSPGPTATAWRGDPSPASGS